MIEPLSAVLVPIYALGDRFTGGGWPALDDRLPGRSVFWATLVAAGLGYLSLGNWGAHCALVWIIYRTPAWDVFGGRIDPRGAGQIAGTVARHALCVPLLTLAAYFAKLPLIPTALAAAAFTLLAVGLSLTLARRHNADVELVRGAAYGVVVACIPLLA